MSQEQSVKDALANPRFRQYLKTRGIPVDRPAEELYQHVVAFEAITKPIVNDGNLSV